MAGPPHAASSWALVSFMAGPGGPTPEGVAERTTGAPGPLPPEVLDRWRARPARVIVGEHDPFFPAARLGPPVSSHLRADVEVLPGVGHLLVDQAPGAVVAGVAGAVAAC